MLKQTDIAGMPGNGNLRPVDPSLTNIAVVEVVYCRRPGEEPTAVESRFSRWVHTTEQPWTRRFNVGADWQPLDCGWVEQASLLHLANNEGKNLRFVPTKEEEEQTQAKVVEVGLSILTTEADRELVEPGWVVFPKETMRVQPIDLSRLRVRCRSGTARCTLTLFPG